jgi:hypothetical protein
VLFYFFQPDAHVGGIVNAFAIADQQQLGRLVFDLESAGHQVGQSASPHCRSRRPLAVALMEQEVLCLNMTTGFCFDSSIIA